MGTEGFQSWVVVAHYRGPLLSSVVRRFGRTVVEVGFGMFWSYGLCPTDCVRF